MTGLTRAAMEEGGTSYPVFGNFPIDVAGKTGTAERGFTEGGFPLPDQAWFVALAPANDPEIVVAVTVERGGFGVDSAAPVAARIIENALRTGGDAGGAGGVPPGDDRMSAGPVTMESRRSGVAERLNLPYFDGVMLVAALGLIGFSIFTLFESTGEEIPGDPLYFVLRQTVYAVIGIALMFAVARVDYSRFRELRVGIYSAMIASICLVLVFGAAARGSRRWIELPYFRFQPSELAKVLLIVSLAAFVIERSRRGYDWRSTARMLALGLAPALLVFLQPDLGTGIVLGVITLVILLLAGIPWRHFAAIGGVAVALGTLVLVIAPAVGAPILREYQQERLTSFLNPSDDPRDSSYQINAEPHRDRSRWQDRPWRAGFAD